MPSSSTISSSDKSKVKATLPSSSNKILTATVARVYVAYPRASTWSYTGVEGAMAFVRDLERDTFALKVVDLKGGKNGAVLWEHELYEPLVYTQDRTSFHTLEGDQYMIGFAFADDAEASELHKKIVNRQKFAKGSSSTKKSKRGSKLLGGGGSKSGGGGKIDKSMISAPTDFKHVAHMGYTAEKGFSADNVDPSWSALLDQLSNMGISRADIQKNEGFIKDFVGKRGGVPANGGAAKAKKVPPPAPIRTTARKQPPPPPAPRRAAAAAAAPPPPPPARSGGPAVAASTPPPPPPPPPPARGGGAAAAPPPPPPPPPPARGGGAAAAPPPPPPPPPPAPPGRGGAGAPPPPPPPPPAGRSGAPPPPPPPPPSGGVTGVPASQPPGRSDLLASIQGAGIHNLKKTDAAAAAAGGAAVGGAAGYAAANAGTPDESGGGDGPDLASALAAALSARKDNMGDSDEDGESEEEW